MKSQAYMLRSFFSASQFIHTGCEEVYNPCGLAVYCGPFFLLSSYLISMFYGLSTIIVV